MTNVVRPCRSDSQAVLDQRLALAVEARRRLVEDQDARIGEDRARDRDALALAARQLHAALADDRVVALLEALDELVGVRDAADPLDVLERRVGLAVARCSRRRCRRTGSCPAAPRRAARGSRAGGPSARSRPSTRIAPVERPVERHHQADERALARSARPDQRRRRAGRRAEGDVLRAPARPGCTRTTRPRTRPRRRSRRAAPCVASSCVLGGHLHQLADAIEAGERLGDLRADRRDLHHRRGQQAGEEDVVEEVAERHRARRGSRGRRR